MVKIYYYDLPQYVFCALDKYVYTKFPEGPSATYRTGMQWLDLLRFWLQNETDKQLIEQEECNKVIARCQEELLPYIMCGE